jgi:hypothetical protein
LGLNPDIDGNLLYIILHLKITHNASDYSELFYARLCEFFEKHYETCHEAAQKSGLDHQSARCYIVGRRPNIMACILLADHLGDNSHELLELAGWPPLKVFEIHTESAMALPPEAVDGARDIALFAGAPQKPQVLSQGLIVCPQ